MLCDCKTYKEYIARIERFLIEDLLREYPDAKIDGNPSDRQIFQRLWRIITLEIIGLVLVPMMRFFTILIKMWMQSGMHLLIWYPGKLCL